MPPPGDHIKRELRAFAWIMLPYVIVLNILMFGACIFNSLPEFGRSFLYTAIYLVLAYFVFRTVALFIRKRIPAAGDLIKRIVIMLPVFYVMNVVMLSGIFSIYQQFDLLNCGVRSGMLWWAIVYGCITSTVLTFINEGVANWGEWKASLAETEKLKNAYRRSKLLGIKGQINPHFLFNCFNTLSGLIHEDNVKAEKFLDEMAKVHRYLLRSDDELLVPIADEIKFAESYLHLSKERFGNAIEISINLDEDTLKKFIPPLSMQVILENIIYTNALDKKSPLYIHIYATNENELCIANSIQEKIIRQNINVDEGLDNLVNKYKMLNAPPVTITGDSNKRKLLLPLFDKQEAAI
jgi:two-component system, LytTR family, sensor kinase